MTETTPADTAHLVPVAGASLYAGADEELRAALLTSLVCAGTRPVVDLTRLPDNVAAPMRAWWDKTQDLWSQIESGDVDRAEYVRTRRVLVHQVQNTSKSARRDLVELYTALTSSGPLVDLVEAVCDKDPNPRTVSASAKHLDGSFRCAAGAGTLEVTLHGSRYLPDELGGIRWPTELCRLVEIGTRYAPWRDRRVRRLASVKVSIDELWAPLPEDNSSRA